MFVRPEIKQKQPQDRKTIFETQPLPDPVACRETGANWAHFRSVPKTCENQHYEQLSERLLGLLGGRKSQLHVSPNFRSVFPFARRFR